MAESAKSKLTPQARQVLAQGYGYRCPELSDQSYHTNQDILKFEIDCLYSDTIPDTLQRLYGVTPKNVAEIDRFISQKMHELSGPIYFDYGLIWVTSDPYDAMEFYGSSHKRYVDIKHAKHHDGTPVELYQVLLPMPRLLVADDGAKGQLFAYSDTDNVVEHRVN